jgi:hypothetical protein
MLKYPTSLAQIVAVLLQPDEFCGGVANAWQ